MVSEVWDALGELVADGFKWKEYKKILQYTQAAAISGHHYV